MPRASTSTRPDRSQDEYEAIDLSDNEIVSFSNFPLLKRLRTVFANNSRLTHVAPGLGKALPGLEVRCATTRVAVCVCVCVSETDGFKRC